VGLTPVAARRWSGGAALRGGVRWVGAGTVVANDAALVLHHRERGRKVTWGPRKARRGATSGSLSGRMTAASRGKSGRQTRALASEANGLIPGRTGEVAVCLSASEKERGERGNGTATDTFYGSSVVWAERKGAGGPGFGAAWRGKW
jgi:hypothetical protein